MKWGLVTVAAFLLAAAKYGTKRSGRPGLDAVFLKVHRWAGLALLVGTAVHAVLLWPHMGDRPVSMAAAGFGMAASAAVLLWSHMAAKRLGPKWLPLHRDAALVLLLCLTVHAAQAI